MVLLYREPTVFLTSLVSFFDEIDPFPKEQVDSRAVDNKARAVDCMYLSISFVNEIKGLTQVLILMWLDTWTLCREKNNLILNYLIAMNFSQKLILSVGKYSAFKTQLLYHFIVHVRRKNCSLENESSLYIQRTFSRHCLQSISLRVASRLMISRCIWMMVDLKCRLMSVPLRQQL